MTADSGRLQRETVEAALAVTTAMLTDDEALVRQTLSSVMRELLDDDSHDHARLYVYLHQAAYLTELALQLAASNSGRPTAELQQALARAVANADWTDDDGSLG